MLFKVEINLDQKLENFAVRVWYLTNHMIEWSNTTNSTRNMKTWCIYPQTKLIFSQIDTSVLQEGWFSFDLKDIFVFEPFYFLIWVV